jgi:hydroxyacylglutathione hydrolase/adenylyltransferase/sulfurtransferase
MAKQTERSSSLGSGGAQSRQIAAPHRQSTPLMGADYTPQEVSDLLAAGNLQLIDVRTRYEHDAGRIAGDRLVELNRLASEVDSLDRSRPVVFYCRTGARSAMATQAFSQAGFDAHNMVGGLVDWDAAGLPLEPSDGYVAD